MKTNLTFILIAICLTFAAQEGKGETLSGIVEAVDGNNITVNHRRKSKTFTLHDKTKIAYVSFLKAKKEIKPGFVVRAAVDSKGQCHQIWVTLPIPQENLKPSAEMLKMTAAELHKMADTNGDGEVSYVEYARHLPFPQTWSDWVWEIRPEQIRNSESQGIRIQAPRHQVVSHLPQNARPMAC